MGKLISIRVVLSRREGYYMTEEQAAVLRGLSQWYRMRYRPDLATPPRPQVPPGSKVQLTVVKRRQP
jgi:hypothetical protein